MADTRPNIVVPAGVPVDLYAETSVGAGNAISVGTQIQVEMIGDGQAKLYSGAALAGEPQDEEGYQGLYGREQKVNKSDDLGAFIWSREGCTVNVSVL